MIAKHADRASRLKWYQYVWLTIQVTASMFFLGCFGFLFFRYYFMNDGYQDFDSALPGWKMFLAACFVWLKTGLGLRRHWSTLKFAKNWRALGIILISFVLTTIILVTKYYRQLTLR